MTTEKNGLRMKTEDKRFSFLPTRIKEKRKADTHLAHCLLPDTRTNASQKSTSQISNLNDLTYLNPIKNPF
jgi:hypothetical protein